MYEFGVLGPLTVRRDHRPVALTASMLRGLLVLLLHRCGEPLTVDNIVETLWPARPPATVRKTVQVYVGRLRKAIGDEQQRIRHGPAGYTISVVPEELDVTRFRALIDTGRGKHRGGELASADGMLTEALGLWRGTPFADLDGAAAVADEVHLLQEQWLAAHELRAAVRLDLCRHQEVVADLSALLAAYPYKERLASYLMLALCRCDRQTEALELYRRTRDQFAEELGIEPGPTMSWLQQAILRTDSRLWQVSTAELDRLGPSSMPAAPRRPDAGDLTASPGPAAVAVPALLPPDAFGFTGRADALASLDAALDTSGQQPSATVISVVSGTAGVGKTTLAVHWAHRVRHRFPDGQLYINLRGFDPSGHPATPDEAIRRFLAALGISPQRIPADPGSQVDLYRTLLADKAMLVVLDNARDPDQVRPLLPGASSCLVLVTSRNHHTSLIAAEGAHRLSLELLARDEARDLLARRLGPARVAAEPDAANELISYCARLPLALAIVAAHAITHPQLKLTAIADQLGDSRERLDALASGDTAVTDLRAVFSWSYDALSPAAARLFRLLGLHPGPDISTAAAASLAALALPQVQRLLTDLARASLLTEHTTGRYAFHDLLRTYAAEQTVHTDPDEDRHHATGRMLDHYLHTAHAAVRLLAPATDPLYLDPPGPGVTLETLADHHQALGWFTAEHAVLLAAVNHAAALGLDAIAWQLAWTISGFLEWRGHRHDLAAVLQIALAAARRLADPTAQARAHCQLALTHLRLAQFDAAHTHVDNALDLYRRSGDTAGQAHARHLLAVVWAWQGNEVQALDAVRQSLDLYRVTGHRHGEATALNAVGFHHAVVGDYQLALDACQNALTMLQQLDNRPGQANTWDSLGYIHHHLGQHTQAILCYEQAISLYRELGDRYYEADTLHNLAMTHHAAHHPRMARSAWQRALVILDELDHPDACKVRTKLHDLERAGS